MKTRIEKKLRNKKNPELVETIIQGKKKGFLEISNLLANTKKNKIELNLEEIDSMAKEGDIVLIPGKVLGNGNVSKKIEIIGFKFSKNAEEKLKELKIPFLLISESLNKIDIKKVKILKK
jgi:large subunit ribosomal protein L18e